MTSQMQDIQPEEQIEENVNMLQIHDDLGFSSEDSASNTNRTVTWKIFGSNIPRSQVVYICQMLVITTVIISCIVNLSLKNGNAEMWVSFFGYAFGAMLPPPKIKKDSGKSKNNNNLQSSASSAHNNSAV